MSINRIKNCDDVEIMDEGVTIIAYNENYQKVIVRESDLNWRNPFKEEDDYDIPLFLTLKEISEQLLAMKYKSVFYVWYEMGLSGKIYQYGNYSDCPYWMEYGETIGYA